MPFALVTIGLIMIVSGVRDTHAALGKELVEDFTGDGNFTWWLVALGTVGALGYIEALRPFSRAFMALIIISMLIANRGFFDRFTEALQQGPARPGDNAKTIGSGSTDDTASSIIENLTDFGSHVQAGKSSPAENANAFARLIGTFI